MNPTGARAAGSAGRRLGNVGRCRAVKELKYCGLKVMGREGARQVYEDGGVFY